MHFCNVIMEEEVSIIGSGTEFSISCILVVSAAGPILVVI